MTSTTAFDWTEVAAAWDGSRGHVEQMKEQVSRELLAQLHLRSGDRVLELGAGTGEFARRVAGAIAPTGHLIASDVAPGMVALMRTTLAGIDAVEVAQLDACDTKLPDASLDVVLSRMVLMLLEGPGAALTEWRRILAPGGRVGIATWAGPQANPWVACVGIAAMMNGLVSGPPTGPGGIFSLSDPTVLEHAVVDAGFVDVVVHEVPTVSTFATTDEHFDTVASLAGPLAAALAAAPADVLRTVRTAAAAMAEQHRTPDGLVLPGCALVCTARAA